MVKLKRVTEDLNTLENLSFSEDELRKTYVVKTIDDMKREIQSIFKMMDSGNYPTCTVNELVALLRKDGVL